MGMDEVVFDRLLDLGHVARDALATTASLSMMCVLADGSLESSRVVFGVAEKADCIANGYKIGCVLVAVNLMAIEAPDLAVVHGALNEVIPLHPILVRCQLCILVKVSCSWL
jgi:hypothetical protein